MKCLIPGCKEEAVTYGPDEPGHCWDHGRPILMNKREIALRLEELDQSGPLGTLGQFAD